jgi:hypothetical protein
MAAGGVALVVPTCKMRFNSFSGPHCYGEPGLRLPENKGSSGQSGPSGCAGHHRQHA